MQWSSLNPRTWRATKTKAALDETAKAVSDSVPAKLAPHLLLGARGERLAAERLEQLGYTLVASNFTLPVGRSLRGALVHAEIDLVAYDGSTLCFVEVKTRSSDWFAAPEANVDLRKQRQVSRAARAYRRMFGLKDAPYRYDVVSVVLPPTDAEQGVASRARLEVLRNFWTDEKFRKRRWADAPYDY
ncbi:MAG: putative endonuclease [Acidobacteriota bacterium]|jgi:putative endonuclease|nr:putative endonuclease [Acidobacteriota bacterium]